MNSKSKDMNKNKTGSKQKVLLTVVSLLATFAVLSAILVFYMIGQSEDDENVIELVQTAAVQEEVPQDETETLAGVWLTGDNVIMSSAYLSSLAPAVVTTTSDLISEALTRNVFLTVPGFAITDDEQVWTTNTEVEIFRVSYANGEEVVTVVGGDGDKVIAPGTQNDYSFRLKNTGKTVVDYTLTVEAYYSSDVLTVPVKARMKSYDGSWLIGGDDSWEDVLKLNEVQDDATLGVNNYANYTLEWQWPFESGNDALDTMLGNLNDDEELSLTIVIKTIATASQKTNTGTGGSGSADTDANVPEVIVPGIPKTGDVSESGSYAVWLAGSGIILILLLQFRKRNE